MRRMQIMIGLLLLTVGTMAYGQTNSALCRLTLKENVSPAAIEQLAIGMADVDRCLQAACDNLP